MAERLKTKFLEEEQLVDLVVGPDALQRSAKSFKRDRWRPRCHQRNPLERRNICRHQPSPFRRERCYRFCNDYAGLRWYVYVLRGSVYPRTRKKPRSSSRSSTNVKSLWNSGYKEITLLGQNVDSYLWYGGGPKKDFKNASEMQKLTAVNFAQLLDMVAVAVPEMRIRFSRPIRMKWRKRFSEWLRNTIISAKYVHLPVQSGKRQDFQENEPPTHPPGIFGFN